METFVYCGTESLFSQGNRIPVSRACEVSLSAEATRFSLPKESL